MEQGPEETKCPFPVESHRMCLNSPTMMCSIVGDWSGSAQGFYWRLIMSITLTSMYQNPDSQNTSRQSTQATLFIQFSHSKPHNHLRNVFCQCRELLTSQIFTCQGKGQFCRQAFLRITVLALPHFCILFSVLIHANFLGFLQKECLVHKQTKPEAVVYKLFSCVLSYLIFPHLCD